MAWSEWRWLLRMGDPASMVRRLAALATWPGWGRSSWRRAWKGRSVPSKPSIDMAQATSAMAGRGAGAATGQAGRGEHPLGPFDQRQPLLERQPERLQPAQPQALGGGQAAA